MPELWEKLREEKQQVGYKKITAKFFKLPDGQEVEFTTWHQTANNVAVIALTRSNTVVIARQFRPGPERIFDEIPGGDVEIDEALDAAAARELREETGFVSDAPLKYLGMACRDAYTNETDHYFLAHDCYKVDNGNLDPNEYVEVVELSIGQLVQNAKTGKMSDSVAVLMALDDLTKISNG